MKQVIPYVKFLRRAYKVKHDPSRHLDTSADAGALTAAIADPQVRLRFGTLLRFAVAVGLTAWIVWQADLTAIAAAFARTSWAWIGAACLLVVVDRLLMAWRWIALLDVLQTRRPPVRSLLRTFFVSTFLGTFLVQTVGSDAIRTWSLARDGVPASESLASVLMDRMLGIVSLLISAAVGVALVPSVLGQPGVVWPFVLAAAGCARRDRVRLQHAPRRRRRASGLDDCGRGACRTRPDGSSTRCRPTARARGLLAGVLVASVAVQAPARLAGRAARPGPGTDGAGVELHRVHPAHPAGDAAAHHLQRPRRRVRRRSSGRFVRSGSTDADAVALSVLFVALGIVGNLPGGVLVALGRGPGPWPVLRRTRVEAARLLSCRSPMTESSPRVESVAVGHHSRLQRSGQHPGDARERHDRVRAARPPARDSGDRRRQPRQDGRAGAIQSRRDFRPCGCFRTSGTWGSAGRTAAASSRPRSRTS